jgi:hypothetical protein
MVGTLCKLFDIARIVGIQQTGFLLRRFLEGAQYQLSWPLSVPLNTMLTRRPLLRILGTSRQRSLDPKNGGVTGPDPRQCY